MEIGLMHSEYFAGIAKYDYAGFAKRIDEKSVMAFSFIRFGTDDIPNTTQLIDEQGNIDYDRITKFSAADYGLLFSYARKYKGLDLGANFKIIHRRIGDFAKAWGFGLDASINYEYKKWKFAGVVRDITSTVNAWSFTIDDATRKVFDSTGNDIPQNSTELTLPRIIIGTSRYFKLSEKFDLLAEVDLDFTLDGKRNTLIRSNSLNLDPHFGLEFGYKKLIYFRTGLGNAQWVKQLDNSDDLSLEPNIGIGVKLNSFSIDYALSNVGNASVGLYSNVFSVKYSFK